MTRSALGLVGLDVGYLAAGLALLCAGGLVRDLRSAARYSALGLFLGWAVTTLLVTVILLIGPLLTALEIVALWAVVVTAAALVRSRVEGVSHPALVERTRLAWGACGVGALSLLALLFFQLRRVLASGSFPPDAVSSWIPKAQALYYYDHIDSRPGGYLAIGFADYPPGDYVTDAVSFRFMGSADPLLLPVQRWVIAAAFVLALAGLLASRVRPALLWPSVALVVLIPGADVLVGSSLADEPLLEVFAVTGVCGALWLLDRDWRYAALAFVFTAFGVLLKSEGVMLMGAAVAVPTVVALLRRRWLDAALFGCGLLAVVPWRIWLALHDVVRASPDYRLRDFFDFGYLAERTDRLGLAAGDLTRGLFLPSRTLLLVAAALALSVLLVRRRPALSLLVVLGIGVPYVVYLAIYWIGFVEIHQYLDSTVVRITAPLAVFAGALVPLLAMEVWRGRPAGPD